MGLFALSKDETPAELLSAAKVNIKLYLEHGGEYLLTTFAIPYIDEAIKQLAEAQGND